MIYEEKKILSLEVQDYIYFKLLEEISNIKLFHKISFVNLTDIENYLHKQIYSKNRDIKSDVKDMLLVNNIFSKNTYQTTGSYNKKKEDFHSLEGSDLIFIQSTLGFRANEDLLAELIDHYLKQNNIFVVLHNENLIKFLKRKKLNIYPYKIINLQQPYAGYTSIEIKCIFFCKNKPKTIELFDTKDVLTNFKLNDKTTNELEKNLSKEKKLVCEFDSFLNFDHAFTNSDLEKILIERENIQLEKITSYSLKEGKVNLRLNNKKLLKEKQFIKKLENTLYIPTIPSSRTKVETQIEHLNNWDYFYFSLDKKFQVADYVSNFLNSELGKLQLKMLADGTYIKTISLFSIKLLKIPNISLKEQINASKITEQLSKIKENIANIEKSNWEKDPKLDLKDLMKSIPEFEIQELVSQEESVIHEYKSSIRFDLKLKKYKDHITDSCLKTIVAFINTEGGNLVIGVDDNKNIIGLNVDNFNSLDDYSKFIKNKINSYIGVEFNQFINVKFFDYQEGKICVIECFKLPNDMDAFLNDEFFVRSGPSNSKLTTKKYTDWKRNID